MAVRHRAVWVGHRECCGVSGKSGRCVARSNKMHPRRGPVSSEVFAEHASSALFAAAERLADPGVNAAPVTCDDCSASRPYNHAQKLRMLTTRRLRTLNRLRGYVLEPGARLQGTRCCESASTLGSTCAWQSLGAPGGLRWSEQMSR